MKLNKVSGLVLAVALAIVAIPAAAADVEYRYPAPSGTSWSKPTNGKLFNDIKVPSKKVETGSTNSYPAPSGTSWSKKRAVSGETVARSAKPACGPISGKTNSGTFRGC